MNRTVINTLRPSDAYMRRQYNHWLAPSHYLNQCWNIVNWTLRNKLQWNCNRNSYIFIQENACENIVLKMAFLSFFLGLNVLSVTLKMWNNMEADWCIVKPSTDIVFTLSWNYYAEDYHYESPPLPIYTNPLLHRYLFTIRNTRNTTTWHSSPISLRVSRLRVNLNVMELVSLSCNCVFILAESVGRAWCKIAIVNKWIPVPCHR